MADGSLTQEEIDLLLQGADDFGAAGGDVASAATATAGAGDLSPLEQQTVADLIANGLSSGTQGLGMILSKNVRVGNAFAEIRPQDALNKEFGSGYLLLTQALTGGIQGSLALAIPSSDVAKIAAVVMGNENGGAGGDTLDSAQIATAKDAVGPMLFSLATQMSVKIGSAITPMPVDAKQSTGTFPIQEGSNYLRIQMPFVIQGVVDSKISVVLSVTLAQSFLQRAKSQTQMGAIPQGLSGQAQPLGPQPGQQSIKEVSFPSLSSSGMGPQSANMDLLMDVQMTLTVELGRTKKYIKELLGLGEGSIIELDKLAGEPVDLLVNGKLIAKGEVVVIDENFGVRVTDIVSSIDRLKAKKKEG